jgi:hypothetical protein
VFILDYCGIVDGGRLLGGLERWMDYLNAGWMSGYVDCLRVVRRDLVGLMGCLMGLSFFYLYFTCI